MATNIYDQKISISEQENKVEKAKIRFNKEIDNRIDLINSYRTENGIPSLAWLCSVEIAIGGNNVRSKLLENLKSILNEVTYLNELYRNSIENKG